MLSFAVVVAQHGRPVPPHVRAVLSDSACADVPFDPVDHVVWSNERDTVWFAGWQDRPNDRRSRRGWSTDEDGLVAVAGRPSHQGTPYRAGMPTGHRFDDLAGVYIAASMRRTARCTVSADPLGIGLVYRSVGPGYIVIASRAALAGRLVAPSASARPARDAIGAGWLAYGVHAMGSDTGFSGVKVVASGAVIEIDPSGVVDVRVPPVPPWRGDVLSGRSPGDALDAACDEMTAIVEDALAEPGHVRAGLTGGKDSRLVLALLVAAGRAGDVEFFTLGSRDLPDVAIAGEIARELGLRHVVNPDLDDIQTWRVTLERALRDAGHGDASFRELAFRVTTWAGSGSQNVMEPQLGRPAPEHRRLLSGLCGEALRTNYPRTQRFRSKREAVRFPDDMKLGGAGILRRDALVHYRTQMHRLLFGESVDGDTAQDVIDDFYIRNRLRRWGGLAQEIDSESRVLPLYSLTALRLAFAIGAHNRRAEWIHHELIRRLCEPLVRHRFAGTAWHADIERGLAPVGTYAEKAPPSPRRRSIAFPTDAASGARTRTVNRDRRAQLESVDLGVMRRYLRYDPANPVFDILDPAGTQRALDSFPSLSDGQKQQLYGALTAAIWLGGREVAPPRRPATG